MGLSVYPRDNLDPQVFIDYSRNVVEIERTAYLQTLLRYVSSPSIVVVTGLRRVGKSVLLRQLGARLAEQGSVLLIDKEDLAYDFIRTAKDLSVHVADNRAGSGDTWVIIDEVQLIDGWERAVASIHGRNGVRVILSGSNATLMAGELATRLAGRYVSLRIMPLSFREFGELHAKTHDEVSTPSAVFRLYRRTGGLPGLLHTDLSTDLVSQMQRDVYNTIALRDIVSRHGIRDIAAFEAVTRFAMDNMGNLVSANRIANYIKSHGRRITVDTVLNYLAFLSEAFVLDQIVRFDVRGKRHLEVGHKYYLGDLGLRNGLMGASDQWIGADLENLVYHELLRRGYRVTVGTLGELEIDFVAEREGRRFYIQVTYLLESRPTVEREVKPLLRVPDAYPGVIISMDEIEPGGLQGVRHRNMLEFLGGAEL